MQSYWIMTVNGHLTSGRYLDRTLNCRNTRSWHMRIFASLLFCVMCVPAVSAQVSATLSGSVTDQSGGVVAAATVTARNVESGISRETTTTQAGRYEIFSLPVGQYEIRVKKDGFAEEVRRGVHLVVGQDATVDLGLRVGEISQEVIVNEDAPPVSVSSTDISGLVGEQQVKDLPLNGRSYDELLMLNPGVVNFTWEKTGGTGVSNSTTGNNFAVSGNRPQQNLFLLNGVEYTGAAENNMQPGGTSQQLLGVDAVREFNVLRDSYSAEYGKRPGAQVSIVTQSGTNQFHGNAFEFFRNNGLDAPNYFDQGSAPRFQRSQFGGSLGGAVQKDKTFLFGNYEGFRENLNQTAVTDVPDSNQKPTSTGACAGIVQQILNIWPKPNGPELLLPNGQPSGIAVLFATPLQTIREDFGTLRLDHVFSSKDLLSGIYTVDDSADNTATVFDPYSTDIVSLREQVASVEETHTFSPSLLNTMRFGFSRAGYFFTGIPTPNTPAATAPSFVAGKPIGAVVIGGSAASNPATQLGLAGSNNGSNLRMARNLFTYEDRVTMTRGMHQLSFGVWLQRFQSNETIGLSQFGQASFTGLSVLESGTISTFLYDPAPTEMNWRSLFGAWYGEDVIRLTPKLTISLGFRGEFSTGWNEANGRAANYTFTNGVISTNPAIGNSALTVNNGKFLPQPRIGIAWSPFSQKTVIRAGFGMYNELQDALGYRMDQNAPFNPTYTISNLAVTSLPLQPSVALVPASAKLIPGGVQPDFQTPTLLSYSLRVQQELTPNTSLTVGYVGAHGYHEMIGLDANEPVPTICPASPCPATYPSGFGALTGTAVPAGSYFIPAGAAKANPAAILANTWTWFARGDSLYNSLQIDVNHRFSGGLSLRGVYTWSKALDDGDSLNGTAANNAPGLVSNPYNLRADWGLATYDVRNVAVVSGTYDLPFGRNREFAANLGGVSNAVVSGWSAVNSVVTLQGGFPFTPQLSYNPSNNADNRNPVRPFINPSFSGPVVLGNPNQWFNPAAFIAPPNNSGFYGNAGRDTLIGPGLATWDLSFLKDNFRSAKTSTCSFPCGAFQCAESREFQHAELDRRSAAGGFDHPSGQPGGGTSAKHFDDIAANSIRTEAALVIRE